VKFTDLPSKLFVSVSPGSSQHC